MERKETDIQDEIWRSVMQEGREEVPSRIWDSLDARLDAGAHLSTGASKVHRPVWKRVALSISSVAAALLAGVMIWQNTDRTGVVPMDPAMAMLETTGTPDTQEAEEIPAGEIDAPVKLILPENHPELTAHAVHAALPEKEAVLPEAPAATPAPAKIETEIQAPEEKNTANTVEPISSKETTEESMELDQLQLEEEWEEEASPVKHKGKFSLALSGNAAGNIAGGRKTPFRHHSSATAMTTGVLERGNIVNDLPLTFGLGVKYDFTRRWAISVGINYTLLSRRADAVFNDADGLIKPEAEAYDTKIRNTQHYIGIPVNVYYSIIRNKKIDFYAMAGGMVEKNIGNQYRLIDLENTVYSEKVKGVQWSANIGIGVEFDVAKWLGIYIDPSLRYYFDCGQPKSIRTSQPLSIGAEIGLRARF